MKYREIHKPVGAPQIGTLLADENNTIQRLYQHALKLLELQQTLRQAISPPLNEQINVANLADGILTIHITNAAWAARLRFKIPVMLKTINNTLSDSSVTTIRIKIKPPESPQTKPETRLKLSPQSALLLQNVADSISDPELRGSFLKLSKNR